MPTLWLDLETKSLNDIKHGSPKYAEKASILLAARAVDEGPVDVLDFTAGNAAIKADILRKEIAAADRVLIHNASFDVTVLRANGIDVPLEKVIDTMALANLHGLPGSLAQLSDIFRLETPKMADGKRLIRMFCILKKDGTFGDPAKHPEDWARFREYAAVDIIAMRDLYAKLPKWSWTAFERELWILDHKINARGVLLDVELAKAAVRAVTKAQEQLAERASDLTVGLVGSATQRDVLLAYIREVFDLELPDLRAGTVEKLLEDGRLHPQLVDLLNIRLQATTSSTAKYVTAINAVGADDRLRGTLQYCGASRTGRWAGRLVQLQNLPRATLKQDAIDTGIEALKLDAADLLYGNVMELASSAIRGLLIAPPSRKLVVADLASIEGRALAWLAGEQWKIDAYAEGQDLYVATYAKTFRVRPETVTKEDRQIGKILELAMGYGGGPGAFATFAAGYGTDLEAMAEKAWSSLPKAHREKAEAAWDRIKEDAEAQRGLSERVWITCDTFKRSWREANAQIASFWWDLEKAVIEAIETPGEEFPCRKVTAIKTQAWLRIVLPSGRSLSYPAPSVGEDSVISFMGTNQFTRRWERLTTFGGRLVENVTQACARDVLAHGLIGAERAGYNPVVHVHDEIICETPDTPAFTADGLAAIMSTQPEWAEGLPLDAEGFECARYRK
jgi:DNA polymerase